MKHHVRCAGQDDAEAGIVPEGVSSWPTNRCQVPRGRASRSCPRLPRERSVSTCALLLRCAVAYMMVYYGIACRVFGQVSDFFSLHIA